MNTLQRLILVIVALGHIAGCSHASLYQPRASRMSIWSMYYTTKTVVGNSAEDLIRTESWHDYSATITDVEFLDSIEELLVVQRDSIGEIIGGVRIAAILHNMDGGSDTLAFGGYTMMYRNVAYTLDTVLLRAIAEQLPEDHQEEIEKFITQSFRGWEERRKNAEGSPVPSLRDLRNLDQERSD